MSRKLIEIHAVFLALKTANLKIYKGIEYINLMYEDSRD